MSLQNFPLANHCLKTDEQSLQNYGKDWTTYFDIRPIGIAFPESTEDVQKIVQWARKNKISLIPSGGRTGLSGGACAINGELVVSFERMNQILEFNPIDQTLRVQSGVITEEIQKFAQQKNLFYPVDFAARGSSQIGGNLATNAGGIKVLKYGMTRQWVTGLTAVTGTGEILNLNNNLVKNATGYDLRHLFIGSEGTLGFITEVHLQLCVPPQKPQVLFLAIPELDALMKVFAQFKTRTNLMAFEMLADNALEKVLKQTGLPHPLGASSPYYVVAEVECPSEENEKVLLEVFENCLELGILTDGAISQSEAQAKTFWRYREDISESLSHFSPYKNDIAVSISKVPNLMIELDDILKHSYPTFEVVWFGHIGDGNLHVNILRPKSMNKEDFVKDCQKVDSIIFTAIQKFGGSISAEHGVGLTKKNFLEFTRSHAEIEIMKGIKKVFDPDNIINPGKIFDL